MDDITVNNPTSRRAFLTGIAVAGAGLAAAAIPGSIGEVFAEINPKALAAGDKSILVAASIAEALAVTTYTGIIASGWYSRLDPNDQGYLRAARHEEMFHYNLEKSLTGAPTPYTRFYFPKGMFSSAQTSLNTLVTLEEAFIAAYIVGVRNFSNATLRVAAARIMGIESDHRTLARSLTPAVAKQDGGPITTVTGIKGVSESTEPPNNNAYERTLGWTSISQAVTALTPFINAAAAAKAGFDARKAYTFQPFTPTLPSPLGGF